VGLEELDISADMKAENTNKLWTYGPFTNKQIYYFSLFPHTHIKQWSARSAIFQSYDWSGAALPYLMSLKETVVIFKYLFSEDHIKSVVNVMLSMINVALSFN